MDGSTNMGTVCGPASSLTAAGSGPNVRVGASLTGVTMIVTVAMLLVPETMPSTS